MTTFTGTAGNDILPLTGADNSGDDILYGLAGHDTLNGGTGNDLLVGGTGINSLFGDAGVDTASYAGAAGAMTVSLTNYLAVGSDAGGAGERLYDIENVIGSEYRDVVYGDSAANTLAGAGGNDTLRGYSGNDTLQGGTGIDALDGGAGNDVLVGGGDGDGLLGGTGADLFASDVDSYLNLASVADVVLDFTRGSDKIDLRALDPDAITPGDQALTWKGVDVTPFHAGEVVFISSTNEIYVADPGNYTATDSFMIPSGMLKGNVDPLVAALSPPPTGTPTVDLSDLGFVIRLDGVTTLSASDFIL